MDAKNDIEGVDMLDQVVKNPHGGDHQSEGFKGKTVTFESCPKGNSRDQALRRLRKDALAELQLARAQIDIAKDLAADLPTLLSKGQVAALLGIPESSVQTLHENRQLRGGVRVSKWLRWKPADVRAFIDGLTAE